MTRAAPRPHLTAVPGVGAADCSLVVILFLIGLNLRPAITSIGALLTDIKLSTDMPAWLSSVVVGAPLWCFAAGSWVGYGIRRRWGTRRAVGAALIILAVALALRPFLGSASMLLGTLTACSAIAILAVLLPPMVQSAPDEHRSRLFRAYTVALGTGAGLGSLSALAPADSWQFAASAWAVVAVTAFVAWHRRPEPAQIDENATVRVRRTVSPLHLQPRKTASALTIHLGLTLTYTFTMMGWLPSILADVGVSATNIAILFAVATFAGVPLSIRVPVWAKRHADQSSLALLFGQVSFVGTLGLLLNPSAATWLWILCVGAGMPAILVALQLLQLRSGDVEDTAALSATVQGFGYLIAGTLTVAVGFLHTSTGSWQAPLIALLLVLFGQMTSGTTAGRPATVLITPPTSGRRNDDE